MANAERWTPPENFQPAESKALEIFNELVDQGTEITGSREPVNPGPGDAVVFRLENIKVIQDRTDRAHSYFGYEGMAPGDKPIIVLESGNLRNMISAALIGHVLSVACVGTQEIGKASPMKVFRVIDHGDAWPRRRGKKTTASKDTDPF